jgi:hypothetical protein
MSRLCAVIKEIDRVLLVPRLLRVLSSRRHFPKSSPSLPGQKVVLLQGKESQSRGRINDSHEISARPSRQCRGTPSPDSSGRILMDRQEGGEEEEEDMRLMDLHRRAAAATRKLTR